MNCHCSNSGYCPTHRRMMSELRHRQCRDEPGYFEAFQADLKRQSEGVQSRGLGDTVKRITDATGITQLAKLYKSITGNDCGCTGRQQKWNEWFRYKQFVEVAITTAPREKPTLQSTIASLVANRIEPHIFAEPGSELTGIGQLPTHQNATRLGAWHNWIHACQTLLQTTRSDYILTVQDDTVIAEGAIEFLRSVTWPKDCGMISLYTPGHYTKMKPGLHKIKTQSLWGACAMLFKRDQLQRLLATEVAQNWKGVNSLARTKPREPWEIANVDTAVGKALIEMGLFPYFFTPSLSQHIGETSSIGHKGMGPKRTAKKVVKDFGVFG